jgi:soluble P-type ATPase
MAGRWRRIASTKASAEESPLSSTIAEHDQDSPSATRALVPLEALPPARPRAPLTPCSACGLPLDPLRAPRVLVFEDGYRYLCGPECERQFRSHPDRDRRAPVPEERVPEPALAEAASEPAELGDELPLAGRAPIGLELAVGMPAAVVALALGLLHGAAAAWGSSLASALAAAAAFRLLSNRVDAGRTRLTAGIAPLAVAFAIVAAQLSFIHDGSRLGLLSAAFAAALLLLRARVEVDDRTRVEAAWQALLAPAGRSRVAEHARLLGLPHQDGSPVEESSPLARTQAASERWAVWIALSLVHRAGWPARWAAASAVMLCAPVLLASAIARVRRAAGAIAAAHGIVYRSEAEFHAVSQCKTVVLSPHGLLTKREPVVAELILLDSDFDASFVLGMAAAAERIAGAQPVARAIGRHARDRHAAGVELRRPNHYPHRGVTAVSPHGQPIVVGSRRLLMEHGISVAAADAQVARAEAEGRTPIFVALDDRVRAIIALHYEMHPAARPATQRMVDLGLELVLLTGDRLGALRALATALDIEHIKAELLPEERGSEVRTLSEAGPVAVIGWSGEDDAALAAADVGLVLGSSGSALEARSVALVNGDLRQAAAAIALAKDTRAAVTSAIGIACGACLLVLIGAIAGWVTPGIAALIACAVEASYLRMGARLLRRFALKATRG